jgi:hypothetical protein
MSFQSIATNYAASTGSLLKVERRDELVVDEWRGGYYGSLTSNGLATSVLTERTPATLPPLPANGAGFSIPKVLDIFALLSGARSGRL